MSGTDTNGLGYYDHRSTILQLWDADKLGNDVNNEKLSLSFLNGMTTLDQDTTILGKSLLNGGIDMMVDETSKFSVDTSGNTTAQGTLDVTSDTTLGGTTTVTGLSNLNGGIDVNSSKFTVDKLTGNTTAEGTLAVSGTTTVTSLSYLNGGIDVNSSNFTVASESGNTQIKGTLDVGTSAVKQATVLYGQLSVHSQANMMNSLQCHSSLTVKQKSYLYSDTECQSSFEVNQYGEETDPITNKTDKVLKEKRFGVDISTGKVTCNKDFETGGVSNFKGQLMVGADDSNLNEKFSVKSDTGNTTIGGTTTVNKVSNLNGGIDILDSVETSMFSVDISGNTTAQGTLDVTSDTTLGGTTTVTGLSNLNGGIDVNSSKFTVDKLTGNTTAEGTLAVSGTTTVGGTTTVTGVSNLNGGIDILDSEENSKFSVDISGNTVTQGALGVSGQTTLDGNLMVNASINYKGYDNETHNVASEIRTLNTRLGGLLAGTSNENLDSLAEIVAMFTDTASGSLIGDITQIGGVITQLQHKQEILRSELLKVALYLNANHSADYMQEAKLTKLNDFNGNQINLLTSLPSDDRWDEHTKVNSTAKDKLLTNVMCDIKIDNTSQLWSYANADHVRVISDTTDLRGFDIDENGNHVDENGNPVLEVEDTQNPQHNKYSVADKSGNLKNTNDDSVPAKRTSGKLLDGVACFHIDVAGNHYIKISNDVGSSRVMVVSNYSQSNQNSYVYVLFDETIKLTGNPPDGQQDVSLNSKSANAIKLVRNTELTLWARADGKWAVLNTDGIYVHVEEEDDAAGDAAGDAGDAADADADADDAEADDADADDADADAGDGN